MKLLEHSQEVVPSILDIANELYCISWNEHVKKKNFNTQFSLREKQIEVIQNAQKNI